jgi:hypothetical protein
VSRFDTENHPDFHIFKQEAREDPGRLSFNHALHLAPGLTLEKDGAPLTFSQLPEPDRARYQVTPGASLERPVQLSCASCHELERDGAYMKPMTYEQHCRACHPLHFEPNDPEREIRHGLNAREVVAELRQFYESQAVKDDPALLQRPLLPRARPLPGRGDQVISPSVGQAVEAKVVTALRILFGSTPAAGRPHGGGRGCVECHQLSALPQGPVTAELIEAATIDPVNIKPIWLEHARFDHATHRALACAECHKNATSSLTSDDVLLAPGIATCLECHGPARTSPSGTPRGGASSACTECHWYHGGDHPVRGRGAPPRDASTEWPTARFLEGVRRPGR